MIPWYWLIPAFYGGGFLGMLMMALVAVARSDPEPERNEAQKRARVMLAVLLLFALAACESAPAAEVDPHREDHCTEQLPTLPRVPQCG